MRVSHLFAAAVAGVVLASGAATEAFAQSGGTNVAVVDISYIFKNHARFKAAQEDMKKDVEQFENYVRGERARIQKLAEQLKEYETGSPNYKKVDEEMARIAAEVQVETQRKRKEFLQQEAKLYYNTYNEVVDEVGRFARQHGIALVLRFNSDDIDPEDRQSVLQGVNRSVVFEDRLNITKIVLQQINGQGPAPRTSNPVIPRRGGGVNR